MTMLFSDSEDDVCALYIETDDENTVIPSKKRKQNQSMISILPPPKKKSKVDKKQTVLFPLFTDSEDDPTPKKKRSPIIPDHEAEVSDDDDESLLRKNKVDILDDESLFLDESEEEDDGTLDGFIGTHEDDEDRLAPKRLRKINAPSKSTKAEVTGLLEMIGDFFEQYTTLEVVCGATVSFRDLQIAFEGKMWRIVDHPAYSTVKKNPDIANVIPILEDIREQFDQLSRLCVTRENIRLDLETVHNAFKEDMREEALKDTLKNGDE